MRKIALLFGTMGVVGIIVGILMSVFIDISNVCIKNIMLKELPKKQWLIH